MLLQRKGYPEEGELVWCTVTKIQYHSVFCRLEEYNTSGMIHISEVSPGRIRNINDYVKEGKPVVCKILKINKEKGHIDLSLRRVSEGQRRQKATQIKQEGKAEKIVESAAKRLNKPLKEVYEQVSTPLINEYEYMYPAFEAVIEEDAKLADFGVPADLAKELEIIIREKIKPKEVNIIADMSIKSYEANGIKVVKDFLHKIVTLPGTTLKYSGGGNSKVTITAKDFKIAEENVKQIEKLGETVKNGEFSFKRRK